MPIIDAGDEDLVVASELKRAVLNELLREVMDHVTGLNVDRGLSPTAFPAVATWPVCFVCGKEVLFETKDIGHFKEQLYTGLWIFVWSPLKQRTKKRP